MSGSRFQNGISHPAAKPRQWGSNYERLSISERYFTSGGEAAAAGGQVYEQVRTTVAFSTCGALCEVATWSFPPNSRRLPLSPRGCNPRSQTSEKLNDSRRAAWRGRHRARFDPEAVLQ